MDEQYLPNLLLVAGVGRNSGKTTFICSIIEKFQSRKKIIAIKISPHVHADKLSSTIFSEGSNYTIYKETDKDSEKDSSKFLKAGANTVFYIEADDDGVKDAWTTLLKHLDNDVILVCEGAWLRKIVKPGLFIHCNFHNTSEIKQSAQELIKLADLKAIGNFLELISGINFENNSFIFRRI